MDVKNELEIWKGWEVPLFKILLPNCIDLPHSSVSLLSSKEEGIITYMLKITLQTPRELQSSTAMKEGSEQPDIVKDVLAYGRVIGLGDL